METPESPLYMTEIARRLRRRQTAHEDALWTFLRNRGLGGAKFRRQHPLGRYIPDFYCHELGLGVELEGGIHSQEEQREYDAVRREVIEQMRVELLFFKNEEVDQDMEGVLDAILRAIHSRGDALTPGPSPAGRGVPDGADVCLWV